MSSETLEDAELVARSRLRDADAFGVLVERHQRLVFGVALARCQDPVLAEDVAQEAFVAAWRDLDRLRDVDRVGSWVAGIARNLAATAARDRARRPPDPPAPPSVPTPEDEALAREDRELLVRALADVPEAHRETLVLYYMEGQSIAAIASALGVRDDVIKQRLSRGRRALRDSVTARVESALSRARTRPAFKAGVVTAIAATGARDAMAATAAAGKVLMTTKHLVLAGAATLAVAGGAIWLGTRASADEPSRPAVAPATAGASTDRATASPAPATKPVVRRFADAATRTALLASIRQAHAKRVGAASGGAGGAPGGGGSREAPRLEAADLDKEYIRAAMQGLIPMLTECYKAGLEENPELQGTVVVNFTIEGEPEVGAVIGESSIVAGKTDLADAGVQECITQTMYALEIDPPTSGGVVRVEYPFRFANE